MIDSPPKPPSAGRLTALLSDSIRFPTVSYSEPGRMDGRVFASFQDFLVGAFPEVHAACERRVLSEFALYYRLPGVVPRSGGPAPNPVLFSAHYDVVPPGDLGRWTVDPFGGEIRDGYIWGRGSLDDKVALVGLLHTVETLLAAGHRPSRDLYFAFGGDEEVAGGLGAARIAEEFRRRGLRFEWTLDEGGLVAENLVRFVKKPIALLGVAEKGVADIEVAVEGAPGHSSMPPRETAVGRLARVVARIDRRPSPFRLTKTVEGFLRALAPHASPMMGALMSRPRLFRPLVLAALAAGDKTRALVQSSGAFTMLRGSEKDNVLPDSAVATINYRPLPGHRVAAEVARLRRLCSGLAVVRTAGAQTIHEASAESDPRGEGFQAISAAVGDCFPDSIVAPFLVVGTTDAKWYSNLAGASIRFLPLRLDSAEIDRIHGFDERVSLANLGLAERFYGDLISRL